MDPYLGEHGNPSEQPQPNVGSGNTLFMDPTISTDDTVGDLSKRKEMLANFNTESERGLKWMHSSKNGDPAIKGRKIPPESSPAGHGGVPPGSQPMNDRQQPVMQSPLPDLFTFRDSSEDESNASDGQQSSWWPETQANEQAQWRRKALAKRASSYGISAANSPNSRDNSDLEMHRDNNRATRGSEKCQETLVAVSSRNGSSDLKRISVSRGPTTVPSPEAPEDLVRDTTVTSSTLPTRCERLIHGSRLSPAAESGSQHVQALNDFRPTMSESLHAITEKYLNIDVLEGKQDVSRFIAYLLDTIELLTGRLAFSEAYEVTHSASPSAGPSGESQTPQSSDSHSAVFIGKVLHQILCDKRSHQHDQSHYEDKPIYRDRNSEGGTKLTGEKIVHSLDDYVDLHPNICFLVMKEHVCTSYATKNEDKPGGESRRQISRTSSERLRIVAPLLGKALLEVAEYLPSPLGDTMEYLQKEGMLAPYPFLFHHHRKLVQLSLENTYKSVLEPLLGFLDTNYSEEYEEATSLFERGLVKACHMTKLFRPNQLVIGRDKSDVLEAHVLNLCLSQGRSKESTVLTGWSWSYDGNELKRQPWVNQIDGVPDDEMQITDLKLYPEDYSRAEDIKSLEERGKRFWSMRDQAYICYTGWDNDRQYHYIGERFMVDVATYRLMHPAPWAPPQIMLPNTYGMRAKLDPWPTKVNKTEELSEKASMLLPGTIFGFRLQAKKWTNLLVDNFHSIKWNPEAFGRLVLDDAVKKMIRALVDIQKSAGKMDDIIAGKGNGLIILLHGSPGTGKTLTAESVAEIAEKPLYRVTCGDIGTDPKDVEKYLETVLYLGKIWNCVLLLDEADVFLEERTMADLQRNSLVSIFLRTLEYYDGILILTSNRVGTFDEAFKSRIQVAIHYDNLTKKSRRKIWRNFFDMIEESEDEDANMAELERRLDELAALEMNGRQIRNVLLTARQLAKHDAERLDWKHLSQAIKTATDFNKYLKTVKGHSDEQWAREEMLR